MPQGRSPCVRNVHGPGWPVSRGSRLVITQQCPVLRTPIRSVQASKEAWGHHKPFREESIGPWEGPNHYCSRILGVSGGSTRRRENPPLTGSDILPGAAQAFPAFRQPGATSEDTASKYQAYTRPHSGVLAIFNELGAFATCLPSQLRASSRQRH